MNQCWKGASRRICWHCHRPLQGVSRQFSTSGVARTSNHAKDDTKTSNEGQATTKKQPKEDEELGPMARRLQEATEEVLFTGGRAGRRAVEDAGFSEELKEKLLGKIADAKFRDEYAGAFSQAGLSPTGSLTPAGKSSFGDAAPWTGQESTPDAVRRMLEDAYKPLSPDLRRKYQPGPIDPRMKRAPAVSAGQRVSSARDKAAAYNSGLSDTEKEEMRREFRERFEPEARAMPATLSGLAALANERIENAIARGQFKDIPRGTGVERDTGANSPFIDTTEYIMNKMIKRQDLVPPWIEKQQDLVKETAAFRSRLRTEWLRHAARMLAAQGGSLEEQVARADAYAAAEQAMEGTRFRDPAWEAAESKYLTLAVERLNSMTRSYNLMAPAVAKKPYYSVERELQRCYAAVAPAVGREIRDRAVKLPGSNVKGMTRAAAVLEKLGGGGEARGDAVVHVEGEEKAYGMREFWRDFWAKEKKK